MYVIFITVIYFYCFELNYPQFVGKMKVILDQIGLLHSF